MLEHTEQFDPKLKDEIVNLIYHKIEEVESNAFEPKFVVMNRTAYASLVAYLMETNNTVNNILYVHVDGVFPTQIFGYPIVMVGDVPIDVKVLTDAKMEFQYEVRRK
jgi:hypothetical protein